MRNPLRRAYRQLSRLIVNEGFKEFANFYGFDPNDSKYQAVKDAYVAINDKKNKELKDYYKAKLDEKGVERSNLDLAYTKLFPTPEEFLSSYNEFQGSYKAENSLATLRRQRERLIKRYAGNVVKDAEDYIVYKVDNFEDAKEMRWLWMGDVEKLTNEQCKKLDPNAPGDGQSYKGNKTPEEMAEYMMSNNEFIMNPSWCVCAGEGHWNDYHCGKTNKDGIASCHLIFSKIYPNCRFCVVRNAHCFEIRDPWQGGGFNKEMKVQYGFEVMWAVFGDAVKQIPCLHGVAERLLSKKLVSALKNDDVEVALQILEEDIDPNYKEDGVPLIMYAVRSDAVKVCNMLLDKGADVNVKDMYGGYTPLHRAAYEGHTATCKLLLEYGAKVNVKNDCGMTPLYKAAENGHAEICELLLENGADANAKDEYGETPLHMAASKGFTATCKQMLEYGAKVNVKNECGKTPLYKAAGQGNTEICKLLLDYGADVNSKEDYGYTPLHVAAGEGDTEICKVLLDNGADANCKERFGQTPLYWVAENGHTEICKLLLEHGADVNAKDKHGWTPLHRAARRDHAKTCELLLDNGADVTIKNICGDTPMGLALRYGLTNICKLLRQYTARG